PVSVSVQQVQNSNIITIFTTCQKRHPFTYSCHQMSAAYITFTYELNRLRNTSADLPENKMSELFTYNFFNGGSNVWGVPYPDSWEASKVCGNASVKDFTNDTVNGNANAFTWMSGYEKYFRSLENKTENFFAINTSDAVGLEKIKNWLFHHDENSEYGGLLNCILGGSFVFDTLPEVSHNSGELFYKNLGPYLSHGVTIVGYNDSVCFDYNNDGLFTNHLDINNDGLIDVQDYEMGAFKVAETNGVSFGNSGFLWLPYKHLATPLNYGGIWNYSVHLLNVKEKYFPKLTAKINLSHQSRNTLKIRCGFAADTNAIFPEKTYDYPVFCFQGGDFYMTGGSNESDKTIEIAIDISSMLSDINPEKETKFFLEITERDEHNLFHGTINEFAIIAHINDSAVFTTGNINTEIKNNTITLIPIWGAVNFNKFYISDSLIFLENCSTFCEKQLTAVDGNPPFSWSIPSGVTVIESASLPVEYDYLNITPFDLINGTKEVIPGFNFPFFDSIYSKFYVSVNGFIYFEESLKIWPYLTNSSTFLKQFRVIAPFLDNLRLFAGDSIWYNKNDNSITINWKSSKHLVDADSINVEFSVTLRNNGDIYFCYKDIDYKNFNWLSGLSSGNNENYFVLNDLMPSPEGKTNKINYLPADERFTINNYGTISFNPLFVTKNDSVNVLCADYEGIKADKTIKFFENEITESSFLIFPNPSFNELYFNILLERDNDVSIKFIDFSGRPMGKVFTTFLNKGKHNILVNTENLSPGLYFCRVLIGNIEYTRKIIRL
ncbi:MAG: T9SS type A sorting domain-containing protein, partial [Bacteroidales bacterium]|nr:T9SS type A sorting domain-containing protein [Bacteroidales bacterium]